MSRVGSPFGLRAVQRPTRDEREDEQSPRRGWEIASPAQYAGSQ